MRAEASNPCARSPKHLRNRGIRAPPHSRHMLAFYGLPPEPQEETMRAQPTREAECSTFAACCIGLCLAASAVLGVRRRRYQGRPVVRRRQHRMRRPAPDDAQCHAGRQGPQVGEGAGERAGARLRRSAVRLPHPQEGADLRGAGDGRGARPTACPKTLKAAKDLSPAQISRANMFAAEVGKELSAEMRTRRCKA